MKKFFILTIILQTYLFNQQTVENIQQKCKNIESEIKVSKSIKKFSFKNFGQYQTLDYKSKDGRYKRLYKIYLNGDEQKTQTFQRIINFITKIDHQNQFQLVLLDLIYDYDNCYVISQNYALSSQQYIQYAYLKVVMPSPQNKKKLSYEILRAMDFNYKVFIFEQILRIHKAFRKENLYGLFFNLSDFIIDFENSRLLFDPLHAHFATYLETDEKLVTKNDLVLPPYYDLNGYPAFLEDFNNGGYVSRIDLQYQDAFSIIMLCIKVFGQKTEKIFQDTSYSIGDFMSSNKRSALINVKKYLIFRSKEYHSFDENLVEDYFFYIFNIFKKDDYALNYLDNLKLLSMKAFIISSLESKGCKYQKPPVDVFLKETELNYNQMKLIRRHQHPTQMLPDLNQYIVFMLDELNSKFNMFETYVQLLQKKEDLFLKLQYRKKLLQLDIMNEYVQSQEVLAIGEYCVVNKKFFGYQLPHYIESNLPDYMTYNLLDIKQKLDIMQQIALITKNWEQIFPLNFKISDFFINDLNYKDLSMQHTIYLSPLKEAELAYQFGKQQLKNQFCNYKVTEGVMSVKILSNPSRESYLICNNQKNSKELTNNIDTWNLCQIFYELITGQSINNYEYYPGQFYKDIKQDLDFQIQNGFNKKKIQNFFKQCFAEKIQDRVNVNQFLQNIKALRQDYINHLKKQLHLN